jgi:phage shock protein E
MISKGAVLIDVRSQNEFARESIDGALNLPLEELDLHLEQFRQGNCLLFCNSGTRSFIAVEKLKIHGLDNVYNLGAFGRAKEIALAS